jgi:5-methylcytosine-specific restriction protein B
MDHKEAFETHLMEPFKQLFHDVADRLPPAITEVMETERWLFSRIPKNDFGQGGAWDFYWGAFYPKGSKRTRDAQLSLWINHERLEFGFYIGDYGTEQRQRFLRQCREHYQALNSALGNMLSSDDVVFGRQEDIVVSPDGAVESMLDLTWQEWLQHPDQADFDVSVVLPQDEVLSYSKDELAGRIAQTYERLFPLVLLTVEDDPLTTIAEYLGDSGEEFEPNPVYTIAQCAEETFFDESMLTRWVRAIERKKQAILYGPPGTGKTYLAEHLAEHLIGGGDGFSEVVQFHPAYAYEDFIQGLRPDPDAAGSLRFNRAPGRFLDFCRRARARTGRCVMIIDEINRANLSRVFGELMYLLEYRDRDVPLAAGGRFDIPDNVRIIGTMNTADRSIALVDHALRRRFAFLALYPDYEILRRYHSSHQTDFDIEPLIQVLKKLNREIDNRHYAVGITFFLLPELSRHIADIWQMEIEPYLEEYFFDQPAKVEKFRWSEIGEKVLQ